MSSNPSDGETEPAKPSLESVAENPSIDSRSESDSAEAIAPPRASLPLPEPTAPSVVVSAPAEAEAPVVVAPEIATPVKDKEAAAPVTPEPSADDWPKKEPAESVEPTQVADSAVLAGPEVPILKVDTQNGVSSPSSSSPLPSPGATNFDSPTRSASDASDSASPPMRPNRPQSQPPKQTINRPAPPPPKRGSPLNRSVSVSERPSQVRTVEPAPEEKPRSTEQAHKEPVRQKSAKDLVSFFNQQIVSAAPPVPKKGTHERSPSNPPVPSRSKVFKRPAKSPDSTSAEEER